MPHAIGVVRTGGSARNDGGFNEMTFTGLDRAIDEGVDIVYHDFDGITTTASVGEAINNYAIELFFLLGFNFVELTAEVQSLYPGTAFTIIDTTLYPNDQLENTCCVTFNEAQPAFAVGVLAGSLTETKAVGGIFGVPFVPLKKFANGFVQGVRYACPECFIETQFIHGFGELDYGAAVARYMIEEKDVDVLFGCAGGTSIGALYEATGNGTFAIGVDSDQFMAVFGGNESAVGAEYLISSAQKRVDVAVYTVVSEFVAGEYKGGQGACMGFF